MTDERTTADLMKTLNDDVDRIYGELMAVIDAAPKNPDGSVEADLEYHARQFIRTVFAYIEGVTFSIKVWSVRTCIETGIPITDHERYMAGEVDAVLTDKGKVETQPARIRLTSNIRFAFDLLHRANPRGRPLDASASWWADLRASIKVRDRLTHPRMPDDLDVTGSELTTAMRALQGFNAQLETTDPD